MSTTVTDNNTSTNTRQYNLVVNVEEKGSAEDLAKENGITHILYSTIKIEFLGEIIEKTYPIARLRVHLQEKNVLKPWTYVVQYSVEFSKDITEKECKWWITDWYNTHEQALTAIVKLKENLEKKQ